MMRSASLWGNNNLIVSEKADMPFGVDLANNYPIILGFLLLALLVLGWKWWNEKDAIDIGLKIQDKVREMLGEFRCTINGDQVSCKRGFASLGKNFSLKEAADMVVRTMTSRLSVVDPSAGARPPMPSGPPPQSPRQQPMYPPGVQQGAPPPPTMFAESGVPPPASAASASVSPSLGGVGGFGGLDGAGGFGGSGGSLAAAPSQTSSMHMGGGGLINPGASGAPPSLPPELQPIETSVRDGGTGGMGGMGAMGGMGGMGGGAYDPDAF